MFKEEKKAEKEYQSQPSEEVKVKKKPRHAHAPKKKKTGEALKTKTLKNRLHEDYMRMLAEFENYKKRMQSQQHVWVNHAKKAWFLTIIPVIDDFELALKHEDRAAQAKKTEQEGLQLIYKKLVQSLEKEGLQAMKTTEGDVFDPNYHEALASAPNENKDKKNTIAQVVQKGYRFGEQVIRFAKVIVKA